MGFDKQAFMFHKATREEVLEYMRKIADSGEPLSPKALKIIADIFDPKVNNQGRREKGPDWDVLFFAGVMSAYEKHGFLKGDLRKGQTWKDKVIEAFPGRGMDRESSESGKKKETLSLKTLNRILNKWRFLWEDTYLDQSFLLWAAGRVDKIIIPESISDRQIESSIVRLFAQYKITEVQAAELTSLIEKQRNTKLDPLR